MSTTTRSTKHSPHYRIHIVNVLAVLGTSSVDHRGGSGWYWGPVVDTESNWAMDNSPSGMCKLLVEELWLRAVRTDKSTPRAVSWAGFSLNTKKHRYPRIKAITTNRNTLSPLNPVKHSADIVLSGGNHGLESGHRCGGGSHSSQFSDFGEQEF